MSQRKFSVSCGRPVVFLALVLMMAAGALASGIGIVFQGFETDTSLWFNIGSAQQIFQEPSGYTNDGGYADGIASATGNYHARLRIDPTQCLDDKPGPPNNDCYGPYTYWNAIDVADGVTTQASTIITSATANFAPADVGLAIQAYDLSMNSIFAPGATIVSVTNSTTAVVSATASENATNATFEIVPLFTAGYITQADIYLDTAWAAANPDWRFDWDSAIVDNAENFLSDDVFNVGTQLAGDGTPGFWVGTSTNSGRDNTYPEIPAPVQESTISVIIAVHLSRSRLAAGIPSATPSGSTPSPTIFQLNSRLCLKLAGVLLWTQPSMDGRATHKRLQAALLRCMPGSRTRKSRISPSTTRC